MEFRHNVSNKAYLVSKLRHGTNMGTYIARKTIINVR